ncbi:DUF4197 domain-containing protein [Erythrobacter dokdonensis]|uniref:DUF4197 domain-containing protein n=1 Tax=Erythrobacter dokdonensis DSW-74 TaxID=1300349 RepID=A0A1A7BDP0_9SPHN|nr:DUF4197 domain-containing protein [Erythrobacter dokdonensis]OBV09871.1 DUF4197 domain-containing protein [Erythrobacter dokdonensis DSW-74]
MAWQGDFSDRRAVLASLGAVSLGMIWTSSAGAQSLGGLRLGGRGKGGGLSALLGTATDSALDKLAQPGAFYGDEEVRIGLPIPGLSGGRGRGGLGGLLGSVVGAGSQLGLLDGLTRGINDAAGVAAGEAKPIFREAIDGLSFSDAPDIIRQDDGGTQYLRRSADDRLHSRLEPLIDSALGDAGIHREVDKLGQQHAFIREAGLNRESINRSVTDQGLDGIFTYIGREERDFRKNPLGGLGNLLGN